MAYASLDELKERLDWTPDEAGERLAKAALDDATVLAMEYGRQWPQDDPPRLVRTLVLRAARRFVENPQGYTTSRAGDETVQWGDAHGRDAGSVYFTRDEQKLLASLAGRSKGITSVDVSAWGPQRAHPRKMVAGLVPDPGSPNNPIHFFSDGVEPW
jgi:hypothetical protein